MALNLMYITNNPKIAEIAQSSGVNRIFIDMEYIGKEERQSGLDTVKSFHTVDDVKTIRKVVKSSELLVRVNPIHQATSEYCSSEEEIDAVIKSGADVIMLPMFKTAEEVKLFVSCVGGRARTMLLVETPEASENIDEILSVDGIDEIHIGLNDLHLAYGKKFMFELLADGTVERLCKKISLKGIPYGFGGIARLGYGMLPAEKIIIEHYRLGSTRAILSRSFCKAEEVCDVEALKETFLYELSKIRQLETTLENYTDEQFDKNHKEVERLVREIVNK